MPSTLSIADLRQLVAARFPTSQVRAGRVVETGIAAVDDSLGGGLETGAFTEVVSDGPSCGGQLFLSALIHATRAAGMRMALLDAANGFDADFFNNELLAHLVWFRGEGADASLKLFWQAADLVVRDNNFGVVVMDLRGVAARELRRTPVTLWYRLQRAIEQSQTAVVVQQTRRSCRVPRGGWRSRSRCRWRRSNGNARNWWRRLRPI